MLGLHVMVEVEKMINKKGVYTGKIISKAMENKPILIVSKKKLQRTFKGNVIALTKNNEDDDKRIIIAPCGEMLYEPDLLNRLVFVDGLKIDKITCLYEKSCGAIVFYRSKPLTKVLLVKNRNSRYWSFPKGHIEKGENEFQTALREVKEETGLDVKLYGNCRQVSDYNPFGKIEKRAVFFLAETKTDNVVIQKEEIDCYTWATFQQAEKLCSYEDDKKLIKKAQLFIRNMKISKNKTRDLRNNARKY